MSRHDSNSPPPPSRSLQRDSLAQWHFSVLLKRIVETEGNSEQGPYFNHQMHSNQPEDLLIPPGWKRKDPTPIIEYGTPDAGSSAPSRSVSSTSIPKMANASALPPMQGELSDPESSHFEHKVYKVESGIPFQHLKILGRGTFGIVESGRVFASKIIVSRQLDSPEFADRIKSEVEIIHRLRHRHLVTIKLTYRWNNHFCLIIEPVADMDLEAFLYSLDSTDRAERSDEQLALLVRWHGCLVDVLAYLYMQRIRHKDIKPPNILVKGSNVYLTDFGVAKDLVDETTTATYGRAGTPMYCAPEVVSMDRHGRSADVFSMGAIFLELSTILVGKTLVEFKEFREPPGEQSYAGNTDSTLRWMIFLDQELTNNQRLSNLPGVRALLWLCSRMLQPEPEKRIDAVTLRKIISSVAWDSLKHDLHWPAISCPGCYSELNQEYRGISYSTLANSFTTSLEKLINVGDPLNECCKLTWKDAKAAGLTSQLRERYTVSSNIHVDLLPNAPDIKVEEAKEASENRGDYANLLSVIGPNRCTIRLGRKSWVPRRGRAGLADFIMKLVYFTGEKLEIALEDASSLTEVTSLMADIV
ncbi:MAG: hypothetical protein M1836_000782 [Candelina mexicana]|nr:MAG: hypothetical protein M1836_000782 [Candelina mexicana]